MHISFYIECLYWTIHKLQNCNWLNIAQRVGELKLKNRCCNLFTIIFAELNTLPGTWLILSKSYELMDE